MEEVSDVVLPVRPEIKILLVDDREDNLLSMETILEESGYIIRKANSGRSALRILLKEEDFTLILMDVQMPDLNGFETASMIYERDKLRHVPIIFITANDHGDENVFKGYESGGVDYIYKPINPALLRAKVSVFVELFSKNHQLLAQEQKMIAANKQLESEIRERIKSEEKVNSLNKQLLENIARLKVSNEELERFAYVASHDLQEPLRKIMLFSDQLTMKYAQALGNEGRNFLEIMSRSSERMSSLVRNILTFSRTSTNPEYFEEIDLNDLLNGVLADLEISIQQKNAVLKIDKLPKIKVNPEQFRQVFQNLIINALKFTRPDVAPEIRIYAEIIKGADLSVPSSEITNDDDFCNICVSDNGIGFEQVYADEIFKLFKRLNSYDKFEGTGIGLAICKKIVEKHKGFISAHSSLGQGATFVVTLPLIESTKSATEAVQVTEQVAAE
jgi:signal transduction histidine kinase